MSRVVEIKFTKKWNLGEYNSEELGAIVLVEENDDPRAEIRELIELVGSRGAKKPGKKATEIIEKIVEKAEEVVAPILKKQELEPELPPQVIIKKEEPVVLDGKEEKETPVIEPDSEEIQEAQAGPVKKSRGRPKKDEVVAIEAAPAIEEKKTGKKFVLKRVAYTRTEDLHKKLLGEILDKEFQGWRKNGLKAKEASVAMEGKDFLDDDGLVLKEFVTEFRKVYEGQ